MNHLFTTHPQYAGFGTAMFPPGVSLENFISSESRKDSVPPEIDFNPKTIFLFLGLSYGLRSKWLLSDGI